MIEIAILRAMLQWTVERGGGYGYRLAHLHRVWDIPKTTFYRSVNVLIENRVLYRTKRDTYYLCADWRSLMYLAVTGEV